MSNLSPEWGELRCSLRENLSLLSYQWKINQYIILFTTHRVVAYGGPVEGIVSPEPFAMELIAGFSKGIGICWHDRQLRSVESDAGEPTANGRLMIVLTQLWTRFHIYSRLNRFCSVRKAIECYPSLRKSSCAPPHVIGYQDQRDNNCISSYIRIKSRKHPRFGEVCWNGLVTLSSYQGFLTTSLPDWNGTHIPDWDIWGTHRHSTRCVYSFWPT